MALVLFRSLSGFTLLALFYLVLPRPMVLGNAMTLSPRTRVYPLFQNPDASAFTPLYATGTGGGSQDVASSRRKVVVVGGGPVGLATAITLSNPPHSCDVVVLEKTVGDKSISRYDPTKAYLYNINPRGQVWMKSCPSAFEKLNEYGVAQSGMGTIMVVPADPNVPLPKLKDAPKSVEGRIFRPPTSKVTETSFWIPRHYCVQLLEEVISEQEESRKKNGNKEQGSIALIPGKKFESIRCFEQGDHQLEVTAQDMKSKDVRYKSTYSADLVVGADGMNSAVRGFLADDNLIVPISSQLATSHKERSWLSLNPDKFKVRKWVSPSTGLRMKVLQFPPSFPIPDSDGSILKTEGKQWFSIRSVNKGPLNRIGFGVLPVKNPNMVRSINVITRPNHEVWTLQDGQSARAWFEQAFPRLNFSELVDNAEWERFAKASGTTFPYCQYSPGLSVSSPDGNAGVVLVGDALHAFPPDIGQGINSGLSDVVALDRALRGVGIVSGEPSSDLDETAPSIGAALKEYERVRAPEVKALIRVARFGAPYQYRQSLRRDRLGRVLWASNVMFRVLLNKLSMGLMSPPTIMMVQNKDLTFRQVMRRADLTTAILMASTLLLLWKAFGTTLTSLV